MINLKVKTALYIAFAFTASFLIFSYISDDPQRVFPQRVWSGSSKTPSYSSSQPASTSDVAVTPENDASTTEPTSQPLDEEIESQLPPPELPPHPIDDLVADARNAYLDLLEKQTTGLSAAAAIYRERRGRHPPPLFDKWVRFAEEKRSLVIEEFFDQLYNDVDPLWGVPAADLRAFPASWPFTISIRNGTLRRWENEAEQGFVDWMGDWRTGISGITEELPDVDLAFNSDDEPHMFVPWEVMQNHVTTANTRKNTDLSTASKPVISDFTTREPLPLERPAPADGFAFDIFPELDPLWPIVQDTCPPNSQGRNAPLETDFSKRPDFPDRLPDHMDRGYVSNWNRAKSTCDNPDIRNLHGSWVNMQAYSIDVRATMTNYSAERGIIKRLLPLLSGCKIHDMNHEILIPPAVYWETGGDSKFPFRETERVEWEKKQNRVMWRGSASGGENTEDNWTRFQRHRFVAMQNGSLVEATQQAADQPLPEHVPGGDPPLPHNFPLPSPSMYPLAVLKDTAADFGAWISSCTNVAITHLRCFPRITWMDKDHSCSYSGQFYSLEHESAAWTYYRSKFLPDIDGASFSGRYRAFLQSGSVPIKATIYDEWHDSRLVPWRHFVPMDNTFMDWWGLLEYFLGYGDKVRGHDEVAKEIADAGSDWAAQVLRREDMEVYMYRVILELARVSDDKREQMGFVADLE